MPADLTMRTTLLISIPLDASLKSKIEAGLHPQQDYFALAQAVGAELLAPARKSAASKGRCGRALHSLQVAWSAFRRRDRYDLIIVDLDTTGLFLAMLFKLFRVRRRVVQIVHGKLAMPWERRLFKLFRLGPQFDHFVCYGDAMAAKLARVCGMPKSEITTVRHPADHRFWKPDVREPQPRLLVGAGMTQRDYPTLVEAVRGLDVQLVIAASSPWTAAQGMSCVPDVPQNVSVRACDYQALKALYSEALAVTVPVAETRSQAGSLVVYEAMAMGKPVVCTGTAGQKAMGLLREGETGFYVAPGDVEGWRRAILRLVNDSPAAARMGRNARADVEAGLNMDGWVTEMAQIVNGAALPAR